MDISPGNFLPVYMLFLAVGALDRVRSTFFKKQTVPDQYIYHRWLFVLPFYTYLLIVFFSIAEFFLTVKSVNLLLSLFGIACFTVGAFVRKKAISDLGKNWSVYTGIKEGHELVTDGIYRYLKHPYYFAVMLELIGVCLVANALYALILVFLIQGFLLAIRINMEERLLVNHFGNAYRV